MLDLSGYTLTFDEEFDSLSISQDAGTIWSDIRRHSRMSLYADIGFGDSAFVDPASGINPFSLQNGALDITAVPAGPDIVGPGQWASGLITTQYTFAQQYGYFEVRAMLPSDVGVWPAFWMLPASGAWPPELDVFEAYGGPWDIGTVHTSTDVYGGSPGQDNYQQVWSYQPGMTTGYHTYGVLWDPQSITFYFDGNEVGQLQTPPDMNQPMYLLADLAVQDLLGVTGDPKNLYIDYIRVYSNDPNATPAALEPISSPDGVDTSNLYGASYAGLSISSGQTYTVSSGQTGTGDIVVLAGGVLNVLSGGTVVSTLISGGTAEVFAGGTSLSTTVNNGVEVVWSGAVSEAATINNGGFDFILGTCSNTTLNGGTEFVEFGGFAFETQVNSGGVEAVYDFGSEAESDTINVGGAEVLSGGGNDVGAVVQGVQFVLAGGTASAGTIRFGGVQVVEAGGTALNSIIDGGLMEVASGGSTGDPPISFTNSGGDLQLDFSQGFNGTIGGFASPVGVAEEIDLLDIAFSAGTSVKFTEAAGNTSGTLTVSDGTHTASLTLLGQYATANFALASDGHGGTMVTDPPTVGSAGNPVLAAPV